LRAPSSLRRTPLWISDTIPDLCNAGSVFTLKGPRVKHVRKPRFVDPTNNNVVERLNGTVREREKVMRGRKGDMTDEELMNGFRTYYNFVRPHQSLNGKNPCRGFRIISPLGENKWLSLIQKASKH